VTGRPAEVLLARHGETEWSRTLRHTGRTDVPLTGEGRRQAEALRPVLDRRDLSRVLSSPLSRAADTCRLAGLGDRAELREDLVEWDYGDYEGRTTADIRTERPGWQVWRDGCPGGETIEQLGVRADSVVADLRGTDGAVAVFAHGHVLRVLAARWMGLPAVAGALLALSTATVSVLGWERETAVVRQWNVPPGALGE